MSYFLYTEVFASDSKTAIFNRAADRIRADSRSLELLGDKKTIKAYGEPTTSRWARAGPIASSMHTDSRGIEHFKMHFNVEGSEKRGVVQLHLVKKPGQTEHDYQYLALDVPGHSRHYLENASAPKSKASKSTLTRWLGVK